MEYVDKRYALLAWDRQDRRSLRPPCPRCRHSGTHAAGHHRRRLSPAPWPPIVDKK